MFPAFLLFKDQQLVEQFTSFDFSQEHFTQWIEKRTEDQTVPVQSQRDINRLLKSNIVVAYFGPNNADFDSFISFVQNFFDDRIQFVHDFDGHFHNRDESKIMLYKNFDEE